MNSNTGRGSFWPRFLAAGVGIVVSMLGTCLITLSGTGPPPVSSPVWVITLIGGLTFGGWTFVVNLVFVTAQLLLLRRNFPVTGWLQLPALALASVSIDAGMRLFAWAASDVYPVQFLVLLAGIAILGFGISIVAQADVVYLPGEGVVAAMAKVLEVPFHRVKIIFDIGCVTTAIVLSFVAFGALEGVREGTVISALTLGPTVRFCMPAAKRIVGAVSGG